MEPDASIALYRAHATARLRGDTAGARRLTAQMDGVESMAHLMFVTHLFGQVVFDHFGTQPDPQDLAEFTKALHDKRFSENDAFIAMRAEALVRGVCGEAQFLAEIPVGEQLGYMWAVMNEVVDPGISDAELSERFAMAEEFGGAWTAEVLTRLFADEQPESETGLDLDLEPTQKPGPTTGPDPTAGSGSDTGPDNGPGPTTGSGPDTGPNTGPGPDSDSGPDTGPDSGPGPGPVTGPDTDADPGPDSGPVTGPGFGPVPGPDANSSPERSSTRES